jgi:hypothetical protein
MANAYILNQVPALYGNAGMLLFTMLTGAGWVCKASGDGLSAFSSTTSVFSAGNTGAPGANAFGQNQAWFRIQDPGGTRELVFQRNSTGGMRIKYSPSAHFTGGSPSATQTPSATDEQYIAGGSTDAAPTFYANWLVAGVNTGTVKFQGAALGTAPYGFWYGSTATGSGQTSTGLIMDPVTGDPSDNDPVNFHSGGQIANVAFKGPSLGDPTQSPVASGSAYNPGFYNTGKTIWLSSAALQYYVGQSGNTIGGTGGAISPFSGNTVGMPVFWYRTGSLPTAQGPKGISTMIRWTGVARTTSIDTAGSKAWICMGDVYLPWDGSTVPTG